MKMRGGRGDPPVYQILVAEVYGPEYTQQNDVARQIRDEFKKTPGVVDVDWTVEAPQPQYRFVVEREKAALAGDEFFTAVQDETLYRILGTVASLVPASPSRH
ncbi:MAG: hypothetical protein ABSG32_26615 [Terriglobia bacterium]